MRPLDGRKYHLRELCCSHINSSLQCSPWSTFGVNLACSRAICVALGSMQQACLVRVTTLTPLIVCVGCLLSHDMSHGARFSSLSTCGPIRVSYVDLARYSAARYCCTWYYSGVPGTSINYYQVPGTQQVPIIRSLVRVAIIYRYLQ